ncbi:MAG: hypothetical protein ABI665_10865 [Vicinamibacterales bacterium]
MTLAHSERLSALGRSRRADLADAAAHRDAHLRAMPAAAKLYARFDEAVASARELRLNTERQAAAARDRTRDAAIGKRGDGLDDAQAGRRAADLNAAETRLAADAEAERKYRRAISALTPTTPLAERQKLNQAADRVRKQDLEQAQRAYADGLTNSQAAYQAAVDAAMLAERRNARDADRSYTAALALAEVALTAALAAAERALSQGLAGLEDAREVIADYKREIAAIGETARRLENEEFERFRRDLRDAT